MSDTTHVDDNAGQGAEGAAPAAAPGTPAETTADVTPAADASAEAPPQPTADRSRPDDAAAPEAPTRRSLRAVADAAAERGFDTEITDGVLRVHVASGDPAMATIGLLEAADGPVALVAEGGSGVGAGGAILLRDGQTVFVVRRNPATWEQFTAPGGPGAILASWRSGERARFRARRGALWQALPEAMVLAEATGVAAELPAEKRPVRPAPVETTPTRATRPTRPTPARPRAAAAKPAPEPEPLPAVCPRCFMQLPASGICDC